MTTPNGACGCGSVHYTLNAEIIKVVNCHCQQCRSHNGGSFSTYAVVPAQALVITAGEAFVKTYSTEFGQKRFCEHCGTPLFNENPRYPGVRMLFTGTLSTTESHVPIVNIWCESKLVWVDSLSAIKSLPQA